MRIVISYDISDNKRRRKIVKILEGCGYRVQYSVFECDLNPTQLTQLQARLRPMVKTELWESIRFYPLHLDSLALIQVLGKDHGRQLSPAIVV